MQWEDFSAQLTNVAQTQVAYASQNPYGAGHAFGIDLDKCFEEVQNSNMSKLGEDGKPIYNESGKVMKGPKYFKPDLTKFVNQQGRSVTRCPRPCFYN